MSFFKYKSNSYVDYSRPRKTGRCATFRGFKHMEWFSWIVQKLSFSVTVICFVFINLCGYQVSASNYNFRIVTRYYWARLCQWEHASNSGQYQMLRLGADQKSMRAPVWYGQGWRCWPKGISRTQDASLLVLMWISWQKLKPLEAQGCQGYVVTATKRSPCFCEALLDPSHGTGAWALQEMWWPSCIGTVQHLHHWTR